MIDRDRVQELRQEIGEDDFAEVAEMFLDEMAEALTALSDAPDNAGADAFHGLRGSALNLGFADFASACADAEKRAAQGKAVDTAHLNWLYGESVKAFRVSQPAAAA